MQGIYRNGNLKLFVTSFPLKEIKGGGFESSVDSIPQVFIKISKSDADKKVMKKLSADSPILMKLNVQLITRRKHMIDESVRVELGYFENKSYWPLN